MTIFVFFIKNYLMLFVIVFVIFDECLTPLKRQQRQQPYAFDKLKKHASLFESLNFNIC